jgi:hypothetical protein
VELSKNGTCFFMSVIFKGYQTGIIYDVKYTTAENTSQANYVAAQINGFFI